MLGDRDGLRVEPALVELTGPQISAVTPLSRRAFTERRDRLEFEVLDLGDRLLTPAFINAHVHLSMIAFRGLAGLSALAGNVVEDFFFKLEGALEDDDIRAFVRLGAYECLLSGTALVWDHYYGGAAVAWGLKDAGLAGVVAPTLQDLSGPGHETWRAQMAATIEIDEERALQEAGVFAAVGPHATDTVSDALWRDAVDLARARDLPVHAHLAQTFEEYERCQTLHGCSPIGRLDRAGLLAGDTRSLLVHALYVTESDLERLDPRRHALGLCPCSQHQFGFLAHVDGWTSAGVPGIVATDCAASNDSMNVQKELRVVAGARTHAIAESSAYSQFRASGSIADARQVHALRGERNDRLDELGDPTFLLSRVWSVPGELHPRMTAGSIEPGCWAHLVVWDDHHPSLWPSAAPLRGLALGDTSDAIEGLMVSGRWIGERGNFHRSVIGGGEYREALREADQRLNHLLARLRLPSR